jgi:hypothetical protein
MIRRIAWLSSVALVTLAMGAAVEAQGGGQPPDRRAEARARFERGVALFDEGRLDAALAEFEEAYRIAPNPAVLFNLGQVHARLGHAVQAVDAFERYLAAESDRISAERRALAERELATQRERIGALAIDVNVEGASVSIDGSFVARAPLGAPIRVAVGEHLVAVSAGGYESQQQRVTVAGGVTETVRFTLAETGSARATIRVTSVLRDVEIQVDGRVVGRTPLDSSVSVSPGVREVRATRPGYRPFSRVVEVGMGAQAELTVELEPDLEATEALGALRLRVPAAASVSIDGAAVDASGPITLPQGDHELRVEMEEVQPFMQRITVAARETTELTPELRYTPAARATRSAGAASQRTAGAVLAIVGGVLLAGGGGIVIWNETRREELGLDARRALITMCNAMLASPPPECFGSVIPPGTQAGLYVEAIERAEAEFNADVDEFNALLALGYSLVGVGAAAILTSVVLFVTAPSDDDAATVRVGLGPTGVFATGRF